MKRNKTVNKALAVILSAALCMAQLAVPVYALDGGGTEIMMAVAEASSDATPTAASDIATGETGRADTSNENAEPTPTPEPTAEAATDVKLEGDAYGEAALLFADPESLTADQQARCAELTALLDFEQESLTLADQATYLQLRAQVAKYKSEVLGMNAMTLEENNDQYLISNADQLAELAAYVNDGNETFAAAGICYSLTQDINLSEFQEDEGWTPIGTYGNPFKGTFDGQNHSITGLKITSPESSLGLFGYVDGGALQNISIADCNVNGTMNGYVGGLAGTIDNSTVTSCTVTGVVSSVNDWAATGGLVGWVDMNSTVSDSHTDVKVTNESLRGCAGGLVGGMTGMLKNCSAAGDTICGHGGNAGGLVGKLVKIPDEDKLPLIQNCNATGNVTTSDESTILGGLVGDMEKGNIENSYATGDATDGETVGGLVGMLRSGTIQNSYATGDAVTTNGELSAGGLVGWIEDGTVQNCYTTGNASILEDEDKNYVGDVGGIVAFFEKGLVQNCYSIGTVAANEAANAGGIVGRQKVNSTIQNCAALNQSVTGTDNDKSSRVVGFQKDEGGVLIGNYAWNGMEINDNPITSSDDDKNGLALTYTTTDGLNKQLGGIFTVTTADGVEPADVWTFEDNKLPTLKNVGGEQNNNLPEYIVPADTIEIGTAAALAQLAIDVNGGNDYAGKTILLTNDISLLAYQSDEGWVPIGTKENPFKGTFDGQNHSITGLEITSQKIDLGLFGYVDGGTLQNINITDCYVCNVDSDDPGRYTAQIGGLAGAIVNSTVTKCSATGTLNATSSNTSSGGLIGYVDGNSVLRDNYASAEVKSTAAYGYAGGLAGDVHGTTKNSFATGTVTCVENSSAGGFIGHAENSIRIQNCYATGNVTTSNSESTNLGGLVGDLQDGIIENSYATGDATNGESVGGLVGSIVKATLQNCYATGNVSAVGSYPFAAAGGIVGYFENGLVQNCSSLNQSVKGPENYVARAVGASNGNNPRLENNYAWNGMTVNSRTTTGNSDNGDGSDITYTADGNLTPQLKTIFIATTSDEVNPDDVWIFADNKLPTLKNVGGPQSNALPDHVLGVTTISSVEELQKFATEVNNGNDYSGKTVLLGADIDLKGIEWTPIGLEKEGAVPDVVYAFKGTFDGKNHTISNMTISNNSLNNVGLFGYLGERSIIQNLGIVDCNVNAGKILAACGGLAGIIDGGTVQSCYVTGSVSYAHYAGGLMGRTKGDSTVLNCYTTVTTQGSISGGVVGELNGGLLQNCYATGSVTVTNDDTAGGVVGLASAGKMQNCAALNSKITGGVDFTGRVVGNLRLNDGNATNNYALAVMPVNGTADTGGTSTDKNGAPLAFDKTVGLLNGTTVLDWSALFALVGEQPTPWTFPKTDAGTLKTGVMLLPYLTGFHDAPTLNLSGTLATPANITVDDVNFGIVTYGDTVDAQTIIIKNTGGTAAKIRNVELDNGEIYFKLSRTDNPSAVIPAQKGTTPGQNSTWQITPNSSLERGGYSTTIVVTLDDYTEIKASVKVNVIANGLATPTLEKTYTYNGTEQTLELPAQYNDITDITGETTGTNAGSYTATVTLKDTINYYWKDAADKDFISLPWPIAPKSLSDATFSTIDDQPYTGSQIKPEPAVTVDGRTLTKGTDFTYTYENNTEVGKGTVNIEAGTNGNYTGTAANNATFNIILVRDLTITLSNLVHTYDGSAKYATATIINGTEGAAATITYAQGGRDVKNPVNAGSYDVTATYTSPTSQKVSKTGTLVIHKATPRITFDEKTLTQTYTGNALAPTVHVSNGGTANLTYTQNGKPATPLAAGTYTVTASYAGNGANYGAAAAVVKTFVITKADAFALKCDVALVKNQPYYTATLDLSKLSGIPATMGGTPTYTVENAKYNGLTTVAVNGSTLTLVADNTQNDAPDAVNITLENMGNYDDSTITVNVTYTGKSQVSITGISASTGLVYSGSAQAGYTGVPTSAYTGNYEITYQGTGATAYGPVAGAPVNAGSYTVTFAVPSNDATYAGSTVLNFTIAQQPLDVTLTLAESSIPAGSALPNIRIGYIGTVNGETIESILQNPNSHTITDSAGKTVTAERITTPGVYTVTPAQPQFKTGNYRVGTLPGVLLNVAKIELTGGANQSIHYGDTLTVTSNASLDTLINVQVDGNSLTAEQCVTRSGSTVVTLMADYVRTLAVGTHMFRINSTGGTAETQFTILTDEVHPGGTTTTPTATPAPQDNDGSASTPSQQNPNVSANANGTSSNGSTASSNGATKSPATGDSMPAPGVCVALALASLAGFGIVYHKKRKQ